MADGMTTGEIEDVLSSIRRLVSDGNRPVFRAAPRPFANEAEKLILTPALRVAPSDETEPPPPLRLTLTDSVATETPRPPLGAVVTAIAAAVPAQVAGWESETGDPADSFAPPPEPGTWADEPADQLQAVADGSDATAETPAAVWEDEDDDGWDMQNADPVDPFQPIGAETHREAQPVHTPEAEALPVLDTAALTEVIREVLREELRGPLGERITANLRRLVRAEIARALALRGQD